MDLRFIMIVSIVASFAIAHPVGAFLWWGEKKQPTLEDTIQGLQKKQADKPNDPYINYNLGVAFYKAGKFGQAATNFDRSSIAAVDSELKKRCFFNLGNSFYQDVLAAIPKDLETADVPPEKLDEAIAKLQTALKKYESVLLLDKQHEPAKTNKKAVQTLLEKLEKKKKKQQEQQQKKQEGKDQNNEKQDQGEQQQKQEGKQPQKSQEQKPEQGESSENKKQESIEQRSVRALLDNLQHDEAKLQKTLILKKLKEGGKPQDVSQRPW